MDPLVIAAAAGAYFLLARPAQGMRPLSTTAPTGTTPATFAQAGQLLPVTSREGLTGDVMRASTRPERVPAAGGGGLIFNWGQVGRNVPAAVQAGVRGGPVGLLTGLLMLLRGAVRATPPPIAQPMQDPWQARLSRAEPASPMAGAVGTTQALEFSRGLVTWFDGFTGEVQTAGGVRPFEGAPIDWGAPVEESGGGGGGGAGGYFV